jgi:hypothetical protein
MEEISLPSSVDRDYLFQEFAQAAAPTTEQQVPEHILMTPQPTVKETASIAELQDFMAPLPMIQETAGVAELQEFMTPMDQHEFMAPMDQKEFMAPLPMVQQTTGMAELQEFLAPMDQHEFMAPLPMVQQTAGMTELKNPYQPMMTQHELLAPMGVIVGESFGLSYMGDMEAGAQQDVVELEGILFH